MTRLPQKPWALGLAGRLKKTAVLGLLFSALANATTLLQLTFDELVANSELVFTGSVVEVTTTTEGDLVYSTVRFAVEDVVLGETPDEFLELRFLGGSTADMQTEIAGEYIPVVGDRGLYFVDDTTRNFVNPLTGWSQGYFPLVESADGVTWLDLKNHPDYGLLEPDADPLAGKMRGLGFTRAQIAERFPERFRFLLSDFIAVIAMVRAEQGE
jgi:hypothetical protein